MPAAQVQDFYRERKAASRKKIMTTEVGPRWNLGSSTGITIFTLMPTAL